MKILLVIIVFILISITCFYAFYGGFKEIKPIIKTTGGEFLVYEKVIGDYKQSGPVSDKVYYDLLNKLNITTYKGFGIFYDNPKDVPKKDLKSDVGCILEKEDYDKIDKIKKLYKVKEFPKKQYLTAEFPYRNPFSSLIGLVKVYPKLNKPALNLNPENDGAIMEIWDIPNKQIIYRKVLD